MSRFGSTIQNEFRRGSMLLKLIMINVGVFLLMKIGAGIALLFKIQGAYIPLGDGHVFWGEYWLATTSKLDILLYKPWTVVSYMFLHTEFFHIFMNMLVLYFTGKIFVQLVGEKKLLNTYIFGGLAGAAIHIAAQNIFPLLRDMTPIDGDIMLGASASVMAIFVGAAAYAPNLEVFLFGIIRLKLKYIAIFYVFLDITSLSAVDGVAHFAHLGGAIYGFIAITQLKKGKDITAWFDKIIRWFKTPMKSRIHVAYKKKQPTYSKPPRDDYDYNAQKIAKQKRIDIILDKISKSGYESLTKDEKDFLFNMSRNDR